MIGFNHFFGAAAGAAIVPAALLLFPWPFMTVHEMRVIKDEVIATRSINVEKTVADWRVTVVPVGVDAPSCQTIPGPKEHEGWSVYRKSEKRSRAFTIDVWVGDEGCSDRLQVGIQYDMLVNWTPRDGGPVVTDSTRFTYAGKP